MNACAKLDPKRIGTRGNVMRVACLGGGPAGLYFAISMKLRDPAHDVVVFRAQ